MRNSFWFSLHGLATVLLVGGALYFLLVEHGEHVYPILPYLILLMCPLMHVSMHKGHHKKGHVNDNEAYRRGLEDGRRKVMESHSTPDAQKTSL